MGTVIIDSHQTKLMNEKNKTRNVPSHVAVRAYPKERKSSPLPQVIIETAQHQIMEERRINRLSKFNPKHTETLAYTKQQYYHYNNYL